MTFAPAALTLPRPPGLTWRSSKYAKIRLSMPPSALSSSVFKSRSIMTSLVLGLAALCLHGFYYHEVTSYVLLYLASILLVCSAVRGLLMGGRLSYGRLTAIIAFASMVVAISSGAILRLRFQHSESQLNEFADEIVSSAGSSTTARNGVMALGLFEVKRANLVDGGVNLIVSDGEMSQWILRRDGLGSVDKERTRFRFGDRWLLYVYDM